MAIAFFKIAAQLGHMLAQMAVGSYYYALNDCYEAIKWIGMAAELGNAEALFNMGIFNIQITGVEGATGSIDTNYEGKAQAAIDSLLKDGCDFAYIHLEGPDEMAHQGLTMEKVESIEYLDSRIVAPVKAALDAAGESYRFLILPDHPNLLRLRTHTADPVPYILYDSTKVQKKIAHYGERDAAATGIFEPQGHKLMERLLQG